MKKGTQYEHDQVCDRDCLVAVIRLRLEVAVRLLERIISASWHIDSPYSCEVLGEAFKVLAKAVGEAMDGQADEDWRRWSRSWANHHRELFVASEGKAERSHGEGKKGSLRSMAAS